MLVGDDEGSGSAFDSAMSAVCERSLTLGN